MNNNLFFQQVKAYRRSLSPAQRKRRIKQKPVLYPVTAERRYAKEITQWLLPIQNYVMRYLQNRGNALLRGDSSEVHTDAVPGDEFDQMKTQLDLWIEEYYPSEENEIKTSDVMLAISGTAAVIGIFQSKMFAAQAKEIVGFEYIGDESWWPSLRDRWMADNFLLIKSLSQEYIKKVNLLVENAISSGTSYADLMKQIKNLSENITKKRAKLIARDQIGKLNGQIAQKQMEAAGIKMYTWVTVGDERVRGNPNGSFPGAIPSHYIMNNILCRWDDATVYSKDGGKTWIPRTWKMEKKHPGQAIQCRCMAIPYFVDIVEKADAEIAA